MPSLKNFFFINFWSNFSLFQCRSIGSSCVRWHWNCLIFCCQNLYDDVINESVIFFCVGSNLCVILLTFLPLGNLMKVDSKIRHLLWIVQYQPISSLLHVACKWNLISENYWNWDRQVLKRYNKKNLNAEMEN